jgi:hypothetical protein
MWRWVGRWVCLSPSQQYGLAVRPGLLHIMVINMDFLDFCSGVVEFVQLETMSSKRESLLIQKRY